mgnify:FL=1
MSGPSGTYARTMHALEIATFGGFIAGFAAGHSPKLSQLAVASIGVVGVAIFLVARWYAPAANTVAAAVDQHRAMTGSDE